MNRRIVFALTGTLLWLVPGTALAHGALEGLGDFYAGLLHPFVVPSELLAVVATALLLGRGGRAACRAGTVVLAVGVATGLVLSAALPQPPDATPLLLATALAAAGAVTAGLRAPLWLAVGVAAVCGLAVGTDAVPEAGAAAGRLWSAVATVIGCVALATVIAGLTLGAHLHWHRVAARVAGSWISACAFLYFAMLLVQHWALWTAGGAVGNSGSGG
ncbi:HupE/UreJ family protein [Microbaculum marinum]|uniref:HupE/UreJ family protein n=1 Tax=Microbaculum marinum TaxID=1764581 RepID=A0AAW9S386_9HYPH